jgi:hypothetical protein
LAVIDCNFLLPWIFSALEVHGEGGLCRLDHAFNPGEGPTEVALHRPGRGVEVVGFSGCNMFEAMFSDFVAAHRGLEPFPYPLDVSRRTAAALELLRASMKHRNTPND